MLLNAIFNVWGHPDSGREGPVFAEGPPITVIDVSDEERLVGRHFDRTDRGQARDASPGRRHVLPPAEPVDGDALNQPVDPGDGSAPRR